ncbi:Uma2 family endonuclease [Actinoallomurus bryophytorum]|uniref:Uma2 family endonuclease n=1 Tax=Actinoallomurus bryophytorum TaxID=1490222 RepID=A0A543CFP4_9ACTN|nr:Uma2 family endonuclease [Actinoallomurus bryophytorum]TQL95925.1 Uma2 family endonuclease [Actinoallomurus bryophytorum]
MPNAENSGPWFVPPAGGFTAKDLDHIPRLPRHAQLIDGGLVFASPQSNIHMMTVSLLTDGIRRVVPSDLRVRRQMTVTLSSRQRPEPDVMVVWAEAISGMDQNDFQPADMVLAVEVVSPDSEVRDRERKPQLYAAAGIPHFWRVENTGGRPTVYVYELDPATRAYTLTGIHHDLLKLTVPFDIDLTEIDEI